IAAPRIEHDRLLRDAVAPILRALEKARGSGAAYFERFNKPDWGIRLHVVGSPDCLGGRAREIVEAHLAAVQAPPTYAAEIADDKWLGGARDASRFEAFHLADSRACVDLLDAEQAGTLATSRGQWSLLLVEELLSLFGLAGDDRLDFYRRGFQWSSDLGRWD